MYFNAKDFDYNIESLLDDYYKYVKESKSYKLENRGDFVYADEIRRNLSDYERALENEERNLNNNPNNNSNNNMNNNNNWNGNNNNANNNWNGNNSNANNNYRNGNNNNANNYMNGNNDNTNNNWNGNNNNANNYMNGNNDDTNNNWNGNNNNANNYMNGNNNNANNNWNGNNNMTPMIPSQPNYISENETELVRALYTEINRTLLPHIIETLDSFEYTGSPMYSANGITREFLAQVIDQVLRSAVEENDGADEVFSEQLEQNVFVPWSRWMLMRATAEAIILNEIFGVRRPRNRGWNGM